MATMASVSSMASVASAGLGMVSAYQQSQATKTQYQKMAEIQEKNAEIAEENVATIHEDMLTTISDYREKIEQTVGAGRASLAAQGFVVGDTPESTSWNLLQDIRDAGEYDIMKIARQYESEKKAARQAGETALEQAELYTSRAAQESPLLSGLSYGLSKSKSIYTSGQQLDWWA